MMNTSRATSIFYEAPHRLKKTLKTLAEVIKPDRKIALARELTKIHEEYIRGSISEINEYFTENDPRGEFVVLVSPNEEEEKQLSWDELIKQVADQVAAGESKKMRLSQLLRQIRFQRMNFMTNTIKIKHED